MKMNLTKLFETQKILRDRINYNEPDRFNKLILALLVELGECANEWRGFKFWSTDQEQRTHEVKHKKKNGMYFYDGTRNPLLEEYADGLHFVLELGLEFDYEINELGLSLKAQDIEHQFIGLFTRVSEYHYSNSWKKYELLMMTYVGLGEMLGFTWEEIKQAYYDKNKVNHTRQDNSY
jgi:dimeric dUTPase (all-alpha-NTP-PPase superfamily)